MSAHHVPPESSRELGTLELSDNVNNPALTITQVAESSTLLPEPPLCHQATE
jgi:hypothetical protein